MEDLIFCAVIKVHFMMLIADVNNKIIFPTNQKLDYLEFTAPGINTKHVTGFILHLFQIITFFIERE